MGGIFVSYRRSDSAGYTGRLMDDLKDQFPGSEVFRDIEAIEAGADFVKAIDEAVGSCSVLLAVIGPRWLAKDDAGKSRLFQENDFVRLEIATALRRDVRVVPVLVEGATMPAADQLPDDLKPLARRQAHEISDRRWDFDVEQLFAVLGKIPGVERKQQTSTPPAPPTPTAAPPQVPPPSTGSGKKIALGAIGAVAVVVVIGVMLGGNDSTAPEEPPLALERGPSDDTEEPLPPPAESARRAQPVDTAAHEPANTAAPARSARQTGIADDQCGRPADVAGTWQLTMQGSAGVFVITQQGEEIHVVEYNGLGQQIGIGDGLVCGREADITIQNVLWGQYYLTLTFSGRQLNGTFTYMGNTLQLQGVRQG
jgi:hypothetical protein